MMSVTVILKEGDPTKIHNPIVSNNVGQGISPTGAVRKISFKSSVKCGYKRPHRIKIRPTGFILVTRIAFPEVTPNKNTRDPSNKKMKALKKLSANAEMIATDNMGVEMRKPINLVVGFIFLIADIINAR